MLKTRKHIPQEWYDAFHNAGYTLIRKISYGAMADVFLCTDMGGTTKAIKVYYNMAPEKFGDNLKESSLVNHNIPNLVKISDTGFVYHNSARVYYTVMDYVGEKTLKDIIVSGNYNAAFIKRVIRILYAVSDALLQQNLVHRDIKPENIVVTGMGDVVLVDLNSISRADASVLSNVEKNDLVQKLQLAYPYNCVLNDDVQAQLIILNDHCIGVVLNEMIVRKRRISVANLKLYFNWSLAILKKTNRVYAVGVYKHLFAGFMVVKIFRRWYNQMTVYSYA